MGDFNAQVGKGIAGRSIGAYDLEQRNGRGDRLVKFANKNQMIICNKNFPTAPEKAV